MAALLLQHLAVVDKNDGEGYIALHWTCEKGHADTVRLLLQHLAVVDMKDYEGYTDFH